MKLMTRIKADRFLLAILLLTVVIMTIGCGDKKADTLKRTIANQNAPVDIVCRNTDLISALIINPLEKNKYTGKIVQTRVSFFTGLQYATTPDEVYIFAYPYPMDKTNIKYIFKGAHSTEFKNNVNAMAVKNLTIKGLVSGVDKSNNMIVVTDCVLQLVEEPTSLLTYE